MRPAALLATALLLTACSTTTPSPAQREFRVEHSVTPPFDADHVAIRTIIYEQREADWVSIWDGTMINTVGRTLEFVRSVDGRTFSFMMTEVSTSPRPSAIVDTWIRSGEHQHHDQQVTTAAAQ
jgi:hypothetical protein